MNILKSILQSASEGRKLFAVLLDPEKTALEGIEAFRRFLTEIGMPESITEFGGKEEDIPELVKNLCYGDGRDGTISGFVTLSEDDCSNIYKDMF